MQVTGAMNSSYLSRGWCNMLPDILDLVLHRLSLPDRFSFGGVCSPWRSVLLASKLCCPARPPPWIVLARHTPDTIHDRSGTLVCILEGSQPLKIRSPMPIFHWYESIIGSSSGWLVMSSGNRKCRLRLLNPTSNQQIPLPCTTSDGASIWHDREIISAALSSAPTSDGCVLVLQGYLHRDVTDHGHLAYFRLGRDQKWTAFTEPRIKRWNPMIFHNRELIIVTTDDGILIFNFDSQPNLRACCTAPGPSPWGSLVSSGVELFLVVGSYSPESVLPLKLEVYKLVMDGIGIWVRVESLNDRVLLIGGHGAESFCTQGLLGTGFEPNCIYQWDFNWNPYGCLAKFSMADGSMQIFNHQILRHAIRGFEWIVT